MENNFGVLTRNTDVPFFPSFNYTITEADKGLKLETFNWIEAYYDSATITVIPQLAVWTGNFTDDGHPLVSRVRFAYSGARVNIKGTGIVASGIDIRGQTVTSTVIGTNPVTNILDVIAYGGMY